MRVRVRVRDLHWVAPAWRLSHAGEHGIRRSEGEHRGRAEAQYEDVGPVSSRVEVRVELHA